MQQHRDGDVIGKVRNQRGGFCQPLFCPVRSGDLEGIAEDEVEFIGDGCGVLGDGARQTSCQQRVDLDRGNLPHRAEQL